MPLHPLRLDIDPVATSPLPVSMDLIKAHCAVDFDDQDDLLQTYLFAAITAFENTTHRSIFEREHRWVLSAFPIYPYERIWLPRGKTASVASVEYNSDGTTTTLTGPTSLPAGTDYQEDLRGDDGGLVMPPRGQSWPSADCDVPDPVVITFVAGYDADMLPSDILNALLWFIRTLYDDGRTDPQKQAENLGVFETLVSSYRLTRFY
jgi:uncharacterized phiE125 gp8 family phage protein